MQFPAYGQIPVQSPRFRATPASERKLFGIKPLIADRFTPVHFGAMPAKPNGPNLFLTGVESLLDQIEPLVNAYAEQDKTETQRVVRALSMAFQNYQTTGLNLSSSSPAEQLKALYIKIRSFSYNIHPSHNSSTPLSEQIAPIVQGQMRDIQKQFLMLVQDEPASTPKYTHVRSLIDRALDQLGTYPQAQVTAAVSALQDALFEAYTSINSLPRQGEPTTLDFLKDEHQLLNGAIKNCLLRLSQAENPLAPMLQQQVEEKLAALHQQMRPLKAELLIALHNGLPPEKRFNRIYGLIDTVAKHPTAQQYPAQAFAVLDVIREQLLEAYQFIPDPGTTLEREHRKLGAIRAYLTPLSQKGNPVAEAMAPVIDQQIKTMDAQLIIEKGKTQGYNHVMAAHEATQAMIDTPQNQANPAAAKVADLVQGRTLGFLNGYHDSDKVKLTLGRLELQQKSLEATTRAIRELFDGTKLPPVAAQVIGILEQQILAIHQETYQQALTRFLSPDALEQNEVMPSPIQLLSAINSAQLPAKEQQAVVRQLTEAYLSARQERMQALAALRPPQDRYNTIPLPLSLGDNPPEQRFYNILDAMARQETPGPAKALAEKALIEQVFPSLGSLPDRYDDYVTLLAMISLGDDINKAERILHILTNVKPPALPAAQRQLLSIFKAYYTVMERLDQCDRNDTALAKPNRYNSYDSNIQDRKNTNTTYPLLDLIESLDPNTVPQFIPGLAQMFTQTHRRQMAHWERYRYIDRFSQPGQEYPQDVILNHLFNWANANIPGAQKALQRIKPDVLEYINHRYQIHPAEQMHLGFIQAHAPQDQSARYALAYAQRHPLMFDQLVTIATSRNSLPLLRLQATHILQKESLYIEDSEQKQAIRQELARLRPVMSQAVDQLIDHHTLDELRELAVFETPFLQVAVSVSDSDKLIGVLKTIAQSEAEPIQVRISILNYLAQFHPSTPASERALQAVQQIFMESGDPELYTSALVPGALYGVKQPIDLEQHAEQASKHLVTLIDRLFQAGQNELNFDNFSLRLKIGALGKTDFFARDLQAWLEKKIQAAGNNEGEAMRARLLVHDILSHMVKHMKPEEVAQTPELVAAEGELDNALFPHRHINHLPPDDNPWKFGPSTREAIQTIVPLTIPPASAPPKSTDSAKPKTTRQLSAAELAALASEAPALAELYKQVAQDLETV